MPVTQDHVDLTMPMGANLVTNAPAGATFRVWAPKARTVFLNGHFAGVDTWNKDQDPSLALQRINGTDWWGGFFASAGEGDLYKFYVVGEGSTNYKRDPYARELLAGGNCVIRSANAYPWHDHGFRPPAFNDMVIYQLHVGAFFRHSGVGDGTFLDVVEKIPYIAALGVNVIQLLPVNEFETDNSQGYNGSDYFAPEFRYGVANPTAPVDYLAIANGMFAARGLVPVTAAQICGPYAQLKLLIDLCHVYGIAVNLDVVYNHAGDFNGDDESIFFWDRQQPGDNNNSLYFIAADNMGPGGLPFALWKEPVQSFLIDHARYLCSEFHADGFRYDEISLLCQKNAVHGWPFCQGITGTIRYMKPEAFHNAEFWPVNTNTVMPAESGGAGFDGTQNDGLRLAIRDAISQATGGATAFVDLQPIVDNLYVPWFPARWKAVQCIENHDIVYVGKDLRISRLADMANPWCWFGRSRARLALGLLMTAPGVPHIFMGQEFLEDKQWSDDPNAPLHIYWEGLPLGPNPMTDFLRFSQELIALRRRLPALRGEPLNVFHKPDDNRVFAFHRWLEGICDDVVVVATMSEVNLYGHRIGFPRGGHWFEVFNSDVYDKWVNPTVAGNGGSINAISYGWDGFGFSASITIPANSILVFQWSPV
jgi:1,4-alpha-glucan branching enzyme